MREYLRVTKPGGPVGMTEMTWLQPPSSEIEETFKKKDYSRALETSGWQALMEKAGLMDVAGSAHRIDIPLESKG